jgi:hypothetical protein
MGIAAKPRRENRTITVDFRDETTYFRLMADGKAFVECVLAFLLALGFQLKHQATCDGGGCLTRHSHYVRVRLGGVTIWRLQCTRCRAAFTVLPQLAHLYNLVPYQRRAQHAGQCGVEVEGGRVPTADWFLNLQILTSGGFR